MSEYKDDRRRSIDDELTCNPLHTYHEVLLFEENLPEWRSLSLELKPHSEYSIRNMDSIRKIDKVALGNPETFCHFDPDEGNVKRHKRKQLPKTLVCHDMANGYHDDCKVYGTGNYDAYTFYNWAGIDIFCYFSHHLVTIPPVGWINVGHAHGVKVIGTIITEHDGVTFWDKVLENEETWQKFADALVNIAKTLGFDGWLLNIENKISIPNKLIQFVAYFHETLHARLKDPELIWYDSVTIEGHLNWQNALNEKNYMFFEMCDGFFTNYSWTEGDVASSVKQAGERRHDLYIGIDVWGRNFYGGGHLNTQEAVKIAHTYGCSLAIFAPAWTHEAIPEDDSDPNTIYSSDGYALSRYDQFLLRDRALWDSLWPYLNTSLPCELPFKTSFCRGKGRRKWMYGEIVYPGPWYNLRCMQYQPNASHGPHGYIIAYIISSEQKIRKESKGILKFHEEESAAAEQVKDENKNEGVIIASRSEDDSSEDASVATTSTDKRTIPRRVKDAFYNYFVNRNNGESPANNKAQVKEEAESDSCQKSSGRSMVNMSVALNLGKKSHTKPTVSLTSVPDERQCLELYLRDGFIGGSCLRVNPSDEVSPAHRMIRVFHCDFLCEESLIFCVVTKTLRGFEEQYLNIKLMVTQPSGQDCMVALVGRDLPEAHQAPLATTTVYNYPLIQKTPQFEEVQRYLLQEQSDFYVPTGNAHRWMVRYYEIKLPGARVSSINCRTGLPRGPILLGHFGVCHRHSVD